MQSGSQTMFGATKNLASEICVAPSIEFSSITKPLWLSWLGRCFSCKGRGFEPQSTNFFNCQISQFLGPARGGGRNGRPHLLFDSTSESEIFSYPKNMFETLFQLKNCGFYKILLITQVKQHQAMLVLGWVTAWKNMHLRGALRVKI